MRFALSRRTPSFDRILLIESGRRQVCERFLLHLYHVRQAKHVDLLSCYTDAPVGFDTNRGRAFFTHQATTASARNNLFRNLRKRGYSAVCVLCTGDPIMTKWKWMAAARVPSKVLIVNENTDFYWLDIHHWRNANAMLRHRMGLHGSGPFRVLADVFAFPVALTLLIAYAAGVHARRLLRTL
jgi:hypothetical protein